MPISYVAHRGSANNKSSGTSLSVSPNANIPAGAVVIARTTANDVNGVNGQQHFVSDSVGNQWFLLGEVQDLNTSATTDGVIVSMWASKLTTGITTSDSVTFTLALASSAKAIGLEEFALTTPGDVLVPAGQDWSVGNNANPGATIAGLASDQYLYLAMYGGKRSNGDAYTFDATYNDTSVSVGTTGGSNTTNVNSRWGWKLHSGTGNSFSVSTTGGTGRTAALLVAVKIASSDPGPFEVRRADNFSSTVVNNLTATFATAPAAGNKLVALLSTDGTFGTITPPSGTWTLIQSADVGTARFRLYHSDDAANGSTTAFQFSWSGSGNSPGLRIIELANAGDVDVSGQDTTNAATNTGRTTGTCTIGTPTADHGYAMAFGIVDSFTALDTAFPRSFSNFPIVKQFTGVSSSASILDAAKYVPSGASVQTVFSWAGDGTDEVSAVGAVFKRKVAAGGIVARNLVPAAGTSVAATLVSARTIGRNLVPAAGVSTISISSGARIARDITPAAGSSATQAGSTAIVGRDLTPAAGVSTASNLVGEEVIADGDSDPVPAAGASVASTLVATAIVARDLIPAGGSSTTSALATAQTIARDLVPAAGSSTPGNLVPSVTIARDLVPAAGASVTSDLNTAQTIARDLIPAEGVSTTSLLVPDGAPPVDEAIPRRRALVTVGQLMNG